MNINAEGATAGSTGTILLIEDERPTSQGLQEELNERGFKVDVAKTASEAVGRLTTLAYRAIVLDLILPNDELPDVASPPPSGVCQWAGVEVLRRIRRGDFAAQGTAAKVPVFVLTCVLDQDTRQELESLGIQAFWSKPVGLSIVAERVKLFFHASPKL